jgi:hypothetical protein
MLVLMASPLVKKNAFFRSHPHPHKPLTSRVIRLRCSLKAVNRGLPLLTHFALSSGRPLRPVCSVTDASVVVSLKSANLVKVVAAPDDSPWGKQLL